MEEKEDIKQEEDKHVCNNKDSKIIAIKDDGYKMKRVCDCCDEVMEEEVKEISTFAHFVRCWVHNQLGKKKKLGYYGATRNTYL